MCVYLGFIFGTVEMLKQVKKMKGKPCYICPSLFGQSKRAFEYMRPGTEWCGITYESGIYYFEHDGKYYCYQFCWGDMFEFEDNIINLYECFGSWYDAFKTVLL